MKKVLISLFVIMFTVPQCFAFITNEDTTSAEYLQKHGYSGETARLIDLQKSQINGTAPTYREKPAWYQDKLPKWATEKRVGFVRKVFQYFDCGLDDGKFMQNNIQYTNRYDDL